MSSKPIDSAGPKRTFVNTYSHPSYEQPWEAVRDYERVVRHTAEYPQQGSHAVSTALDLPRSRIRTWVDNDGMPDCYRGLQRALDNCWVSNRWDTRTSKALNCLAAWCLSSGAISKNWTPSFITDDDRGAEQLRGYARMANIHLRRVWNVDDERTVEWRPRDDASILGRVLYTWTGIQGDKNETSTHFPTYLANTPDHIVESFAQVYVKQRGVYRHDRGEYVQINVTRNELFRKSLKSCLERAVENADEIRGEGWPIRIYGSALETLYRYPELGDE